MGMPQSADTFLRALTEDMKLLHLRRTQICKDPLLYFSRTADTKDPMTKRQFPISFGSIALLLASSGAAHAQTAPTTYILTQVNSMMGPAVTMKVYRDGSKALMENSHPADGGGKIMRTRTLYDIQAGTSISWDADNLSNGCGTGTFRGDWGDPFQGSASMNADLAKEGAKETGSETLLGISAKVFALSNATGAFKAWVDPKSGLLLKLEMSAPNGPKRTMVEVTAYSPAKPPAAVLAAPKVCIEAAKAPSPDLMRYAKETGGELTDFVDATKAPDAPSTNSCTVLFRAVGAGSMQTVTGYKLTMDDVSKTAELRNGVLRIDNAPQQFKLDLTNANGGSEATVYRQCPFPQTVLLMVLKNPAVWGEGADWIWVKAGKWAK
jgi:hypothetical protein